MCSMMVVYSVTCDESKSISVEEDGALRVDLMRVVGIGNGGGED